MDAKRKAKLHGAVYALADMLRITGILLQPFMPSKAAELLDILGVSSDRRRFQDAVFGADLLYGKGTVEPGKNDWDGLFPRLPVED